MQTRMQVCLQHPCRTFQDQNLDFLQVIQIVDVDCWLDNLHGWETAPRPLNKQPTFIHT